MAASGRESRLREIDEGSRMSMLTQLAATAKREGLQTSDIIRRAIRLLLAKEK
jgi:hypothetical protein